MHFLITTTSNSSNPSHDVRDFPSSREKASRGINHFPAPLCLFVLSFSPFLPFSALPLTSATRSFSSFSPVPMRISTVGRYDLKKMHDASLDKFNRYGPIVREEYEWRRPVVHLFDPVDFEKIFRSKEKCPKRPESEFVKHYRLQNPDRYPSVGMAHSQGEEWYEERQRIAPILLTKTSSPGVPENHIPKQNKICNDFIAYLSDRKDIDHVILDVREATNRLALESICSLCLGMRMGTLTSDSPLQQTSSSPPESAADCTSGRQLISLTGKLFNSYNKLYYGLPTWKLYRSASYKEFCEVEDDIYNMTMRFIEQHIRESGGIAEASDRPASILEALINLPNFDPRHIPITVSDFIAGGTFTVANSLTYLIQNLACNAETQEMIHRELHSAGLSRDAGSEISSDDLSRIPYLRAAVKESFRMTSTIPAIVRILENDTILSGYLVPKGVSIFVTACHLATLSRVFPASFTMSEYCCLFYFLFFSKQTKVFCHFLVTCQTEKVFRGCDVVQAGAMAGPITSADQSVRVHAVRDRSADVCRSAFHGTPAAHDGGQTGAQLPHGADEGEAVPVSRVHRRSLARRPHPIHSTYTQMRGHLTLRGEKNDRTIPIATSHVKDGAIFNTPR